MGDRQRAGAKANAQQVGKFELTTAKSGQVLGMAARWLRADVISPWGPGEWTIGALGPAPLEVLMANGVSGRCMCKVPPMKYET